MDRFLDRVVGVAAGAVDVGDRMAHGAGDAGIGQLVRCKLVAGVVEPWIIELAGEERNRVVTAGAEPRALDVAVPFKDHPSGLADGRVIGGVVERAEAVDTVHPALVNIGVARLAVLVVEERAGRDEVAGGGAGERGKEVPLPRRRSRHVPPPRILPVQKGHGKGKDPGHRSPRQPHRPPDSPTGEPVKHEQPDHRKRGNHMCPVEPPAQEGFPDVDQRPGEQNPGGQNQEARHKESEPRSNRPPVGAAVGVADMEQTEEHHRRNDGKAQDQVEEEHPLIEIVLVGAAGRPLGHRDRHQVDRVDAEHGKEAQEEPQEPAEPRADDGDVAVAAGRCRALLRWLN